MDHVRPVALLEVDPLGHRLRYLRLLYDALPPTGRLLVLPRAVLDSPEYREHLAPAVAPTDVVAVKDGPRRALLDVALATAGDSGGRLVVPDGDKQLGPLLAAALRARLRRRRLPPVTVLLMRTALPGGPERATPGMLVKPVLVAAVGALPEVRLRFLTDAFGVVTRRRGFPGLLGVADPVEVPDRPDSDPPPSGRGPADGRLRVGVFGVVSARKNLPVLLDAATADGSLELVVGGRCTPDVRTLLTADPRAVDLTAAGRLAVDDRLLDAAAFDAALRGVHVVAVLHDNDAPSGLVAEACARGVPVLGPDRGWAAAMVARTGIGRTVAVDDAVAVRAALAALAAGHDGYAAAARRTAARLGTRSFVSGLLSPTAP